MGDQDGHDAIAKVLLAQDGVDLDIADFDGRTVLSWAGMNRRGEIVCWLLEWNNVNPDTPDGYDRTPLSLAKQVSFSSEQIPILAVLSLST